MYLFVDKENIENMPKNCRKDVDVVYVDVSKVRKTTKGHKADKLGAVAKLNRNEPEELYNKVRRKKKEKCPRKATSWDTVQDRQHVSISQPQPESHEQPSLLSVDQEGEITGLPESARKDKAKKKKKLSSPWESGALARPESPDGELPEGLQVASEIGAGEGSDVLRRVEGSIGMKEKPKKRKRVSVGSAMASGDESSENTHWRSTQGSDASIEGHVKPRPQKESHEQPSFLKVDQGGEIPERPKSAHSRKAKKKKKKPFSLQELEALARPESPDRELPEGSQVVSEIRAGEGSDVLRRVEGSIGMKEKPKKRKRVSVESAMASGDESSQNTHWRSTQGSDASIEGHVKPRPQKESHEQPSFLKVDQGGEIPEQPQSAHRRKAKKKKKKSEALARPASPDGELPEGSQVVSEIRAEEGSDVLRRVEGSIGVKKKPKKRKRVSVGSAMASGDESSENTHWRSTQGSDASIEGHVKPRPQKESHEQPSFLKVDQGGEIPERPKSAHSRKAKKKKKKPFSLQELEALARPESPDRELPEGSQVVSEIRAGEGSDVLRRVEGSIGMKEKPKKRKRVSVESAMASGDESSQNTHWRSTQGSDASIEGHVKPRPQKESHEQPSFLKVDQGGEIPERPKSAHRRKAKKKKKKSEAFARPESPNNPVESQVGSEVRAGEGSDVLRRVKVKVSSKRRKRASVQGTSVRGDDFLVHGENSEDTLCGSVAGSRVLIEENGKEVAQEEQAQEEQTQASSGKKRTKEARRSEPTCGEESHLDLAGAPVRLASEDWTESDHSDVDLHSAVRQLQEFIPDIKARAATTIKRMYHDDLERFKEFKEQGVAIRFGKFSAKENKQIEENVQDFLSLTGIENADRLLYTDRYPEEKAAITNLKRTHAFRLHIGKGIARPWKLVYYRAKKIFDVNNYKGRYSRGDTEKLKACQSLHGNDWKKIGAIVARSSLSVALKFSQIRNKRNHGVWSKAETQKLIKAVEEVILRKMSPQELNRMDSKLQENPDSRLSIVREKLYKGISWVEVEAKVETRNWMQCKSKWTEILTKRMTNGGFVYRGINALQAKINLIERLYEINVEDANEIDWEDLASAIGDVPPSFVQTKFYKLKAACVPFWQKKTFPEIIDYLYETSLPLLKEKLKKKMEKKGTKVQTPAAPKRVFLFKDIFYCEDDDSEGEDMEEQS